MNVLSRRAALVATAGVLGALAGWPASATTALPKIVVHKSPECRCCQKWADHLSAAGFPVETVASTQMDAVKARLGVPVHLRSCHTAEVAGYVVEGHVPALAVRRLLDQRPQAIGLAVRDMPAGSPGMEGGEPDTFDVVIFTREAQQIFARYRGAVELSRS